MTEPVIVAWGVEALQPDRMYAFSDDPALVVRDTADVAAHFKPTGIWYSHGGEDSWMDWCCTEDCQIFLRRYLYRIELDYRDICQLRNQNDMEQFTEQFGEKEPGWEFIQNIDWAKVQKTYSGLEIIPYLWECRLNPNTHWYYGWDCASGCVWRKKAVTNIQLIGENPDVQPR